MAKKHVLPPIKVKPRSENQKIFIESLNRKDFLLAEGMPGCGKTFLSIGLGCQLLQGERIEKIVVCQSTAHISKSMGYTGGNYREKCLDYFDQHVEYFEQHLTPQIFKKLWEDKTIELVATEILRGRNFENTLMILDESQMCTKYDVLTFMSRISKGSKLIMLGDRYQCENPLSCFFAKMIDNLEDDDLAKICFVESDICRHNIMARLYNKLTKL